MPVFDNPALSEEEAWMGITQDMRFTVVAVVLMFTAMAACAVPGICAGRTDADPSLSGVLFDESPVAIINGMFVKEGESVDGWVVETIGGNYVQLRCGDRTLLRQMPGTRLAPKQAREPSVEESDTEDSAAVASFGPPAGSAPVENTPMVPDQKIAIAMRDALHNGTAVDTDSIAAGVAERFHVPVETVKHIFMEYVVGGAEDGH